MCDGEGAPCRPLHDLHAIKVHLQVTARSTHNGTGPMVLGWAETLSTPTVPPPPRRYGHGERDQITKILQETMDTTIRMVCLIKMSLTASGMRVGHQKLWLCDMRL